MKTQYAGIDYSNGMSNIDTESNIHYGIIPVNEVLQAWADSSIPIFGGYCPYCGNKIAKDLDGMQTMNECPNCKQEFDENSFDFIDPDIFVYEHEGYVCQQSADDSDIMLIKSPYYTYAQFCSPCAPGAGYLFNSYKLDIPVDNNLTAIMYQVNAEKAGFPKVYCFGHDWFEGGKAPYPVFDEKTGKLVK